MPRTLTLTRKQERFVQEYLVDLNATAAARRAGYSERNADKIGPQLLGKTRVADAIAAAMVKQAAEINLTARDVIRGLLREATYYGEGCSPGARVSAWSWLGKHFALFEERVKVSGAAVQYFIGVIRDEFPHITGNGNGTAGGAKRPDLHPPRPLPPPADQ